MLYNRKLGSDNQHETQVFKDALNNNNNITYDKVKWCYAWEILNNRFLKSTFI